MCALLRGIYNFVSLLVLEKDLTCKCSCGRNQVQHVVPYTGAQFTVNSQINWTGDSMTQQDADIMFGLFLGLSIFWFLLWLDKAWRDCGFCSWMPRFSRIKGFFRRQYPKTKLNSREDSIRDGDYYFDASDNFD